MKFKTYSIVKKPLYTQAETHKHNTTQRNQKNLQEKLWKTYQSHMLADLPRPFDTPMANPSDRNQVQQPSKAGRFQPKLSQWSRWQRNRQHPAGSLPPTSPKHANVDRPLQEEPLGTHRRLPQPVRNSLVSRVPAPYWEGHSHTFWTKKTKPQKANTGVQYNGVLVTDARAFLYTQVIWSYKRATDTVAIGSKDKNVVLKSSVWHRMSLYTTPTKQWAYPCYRPFNRNLLMTWCPIQTKSGIS